MSLFVLCAVLQTYVVQAAFVKSYVKILLTQSSQCIQVVFIKSIYKESLTAH